MRLCTDARRALEGVEGRILRAGSLEQLVRHREQLRRYVEADGLGGLEVDQELEPSRFLHGQVARLGAFEDAVDIARRPAPAGGIVRRIRDETAFGDEITLVVDRR